MLNFIDISNWQKGLNLSDYTSQISSVVVKATEGLTYVDPSCDGFVQQAINLDLPFGFYHFGRNNNAADEAIFFVENTKGYFEKSPHGIPILDWEDNQSISWVNEFVETVHKLTGIWCWVYGNAWRFNQGVVNENCMRWVAGYPGNINTFEVARQTTCPYEVNNGLVGAWQFTSSLDGKNLDGDIFYGDVKAWNAYAGNNSDNSNDNTGDDINNSSVEVIETDKHKITIEEK